MKESLAKRGPMGVMFGIDLDTCMENERVTCLKSIGVVVRFVFRIRTRSVCCCG